MSSFPYAMSSYIWRILKHTHYVSKCRHFYLIYSTHLLYNSILLPLTASFRRRPSPSPASHVTFLTVHVFYVPCHMTDLFCTVIMAVLSYV